MSSPEEKKEEPVKVFKAKLKTRICERLSLPEGLAAGKERKAGESLFLRKGRFVEISEEELSFLELNHPKIAKDLLLIETSKVVSKRKVRKLDAAKSSPPASMVAAKEAEAEAKKKAASRALRRKSPAKKPAKKSEE